MEEEKTVWQDADAKITRIKSVKGKKLSPSTQMDALKKCADMAADEIMDMLKDENQFTRHVFQEKSSGTVTEIELKTRNIRHLRDVIQAIKELADVVRSLNGLLSPDAEREMSVQLKKLELEARKIAPPDKDGAETGVVLLPAPEEEHA
ncbi:MAG: hypothetical protein IKJ65_09735 [Clostridia bacterium]|nr:hypothetical protein [Clostridia bacterium]